MILMIFMQGKRGLSAVVTTLVIILLVLVSTGIIWVVVRNVIESGSEQIELGQFTLDLEIKSVKIEGSDVTTVVVRRNPGEGNFIGINFIFSNGTDTEVIREDVVLNELNERSFTLTLTEISTANLKDVSVAPIYESASGKENEGDVADSFEVTESMKSGISGDVVLEPLGNFEKLGFKGTGREEYSISSQSEDIVKIKTAIVDPVDVLPGDNQTFTVYVYSPYGVVSVVSTTELDNSTLDLDLQEIEVDGEGNQVFSATWVVNDVHAITYRTTIVAIDAEGNSDNVTLTWTDSCQSLIAFSDHGVTTKTISSTCTTTAGAVGGIDASNVVIGANVNLIIATGSQFIFNSGKSLTITASGASITNTGSGSFGNGDLYYSDSDGDGYATGTTLYTSSGAGRVRASDASILGENDCSSDVDVYRNVASLARDYDQDGYRSTVEAIGTKCVGTSTTISGRTYYKNSVAAFSYIPSGQSLGSDCYDSSTDIPNSALIHPGQTAWFSSPVGGSWWDYDCSGVSDKRWTTTGGSCQTCSTEAAFRGETPEWESLQGEGEAFEWIPLQPEGPPGECFVLDPGSTGWVGSAPSCGSIATYYTNTGDCFIDDCPSTAYNCNSVSRTQQCH